MSGPAPRIAAFFDFDRTIIDQDGGVLFGHELVRIFRRRILEDRPGTIGWAYRILRYHLRIASILTRSLVGRLLYRVKIIKRSTLVNIGYGAMKDVRVDELRSLARDFCQEVLQRHIYPDAARLMGWHRDQGHLVVVATTNMRLLVEHMRGLLPIDDLIATDLLEVDGLATGKIAGPTYGVEKAEAIRAYAHRNGISLPRSYAYTDHFSDHYILPLVGHPHVVNPGLRLRRMARRHRWTILRFPPSIEPASPVVATKGGKTP